MISFTGAQAPASSKIDHRNHYEQAELNYSPAYAKQAVGSKVLKLQIKNRARWPFDLLSIGHSIGSYQSYGWGAAYFHHGLDIRGDAGTPVLAARGGKVINVGNYAGGSRYYWEVAILDEDGYIWQYHHINHETIPEDVTAAFSTGTTIEAGTKIGEIVDWPASTYGEIYHHIHLNVLGEGGVYLNPFEFLEFLPDENGPEIQKIGLLNKNRRPISRNRISGDYAIYVETRDLILHSQFYVPPYSVSYRIDGGNWQNHWAFSQLPGGSDREAHIGDFYVPSRTCGNYRCRKIFLDLGFKPDGRKAFPQDQGNHHIDVKVSDFRGNEAVSTYKWKVKKKRD